MPTARNDTYWYDCGCSAISSAITVRCRRHIFLPCLLKLKWGGLNTHNMNTVLRTSSPEFAITLILKERLELVEIFYFHMPFHGTFVRQYNTRTNDSCNVWSKWFNREFRLWQGVSNLWTQTRWWCPLLYIFPHTTSEPAAHNNGCGPLS
jgi:hypothetical protein